MKAIIIFDHIAKKVYSSTDSFKTLQATLNMERPNNLSLDVSDFKIILGESEPIINLTSLAHCNLYFVDIL